MKSPRSRAACSSRDRTRCLKRRNKRASHLPMHKRPKSVSYQLLSSSPRRELWTFRPRVLGGNDLSRRWKFHREKSEWKAALRAMLLSSPVSRHTKPVRLSVVYSEPTRSRDPSNVDAGAMKALLDALTECGILQDDNWAWIRPPHRYDWRHDSDDPRIEILMEEE